LFVLVVWIAACTVVVDERVCFVLRLSGICYV